MPPEVQTTPEDQTTVDAALEDQDGATPLDTTADDGPVSESPELPEEFTLEDLEGLTKGEQDAILKDQAADKAAAEEAAAKDAPAPDPDPQPDPKPEPAPAPKVNVDLDKAKADLETLSTERSKLNEQYADGEISEADFNSRLDDIIDWTADAKAATKAAELIDKGAQGAADQEWYTMVGGYMDKYPELRSEAHLQGFNQSLIAVETSQPNLPDAEKVRLAHQNYGAYAHSIGAPLTTPPPAAGGKTPTTKLEDPGPRPDLPPTPAKTPAADIQSQSDGRFAQVDRLTEAGDVYSSEKAYDQMSASEQEKYLNEVS